MKASLTLFILTLVGAFVAPTLGTGQEKKDGPTAAEREALLKLGARASITSASTPSRANGTWS
jgi:hypothetical protein